MTSSKSRVFGRVILGIVLTAALGEGAARIIDHVHDTDSSVAPLPDPDTSVIVPHPYVGYIPRPSFSAAAPGSPRSFRHNAHGFRGAEVEMPKPPRTFRIACIGGSTTQALRSESDEETWPSRLAVLLQARLPADSPYDRVECLNAGAGGYTSMESFINLKTRLLPLDLDLVVDYDAVNDSQVVLRSGFKPDYTHVRRSWTPPPERSLPLRLFGWSHLFGMFLDPAQRSGAVYTKDSLFVDNYADIPLVEFQDIGPGIENFYFTMREIAAISRVYNVPVVLCTFAWPHSGKNAPSEKVLESGTTAVLIRLNDAIRAAAAIEHVQLVDLERLGPTESRDYVDPIHPNAAGYDAMARVLADALLAQGVLDKPPVRAAVPARILSPTPSGVDGSVPPR